MSFTLEAPWPGSQTKSILPNPRLGNNENIQQSINIKRSITGTVRTYVKRNNMVKGDNRHKMQWSFVLTRNKAIEVLEFVKAYHASQMRVTDHLGREFIGYVMNNPLEITMARRGNPAVQNLPNGELCEVEIEFEGSASLPPRPPIVSDGGGAMISSINFQQSVLVDPGLSMHGMKHNWDAFNLTGLSNGDKINSWPADSQASSNVALVPHPTGYWPFDPSLDYAPMYTRDIIGPGMPSAYFGTIRGNRVISNAAMRSASNVSMWPQRQGTVFMVFAHSVGNPPGSVNRWFQSRSEFTLWSMRNSANQAKENFSITGGVNSFAPAAFRVSPGNTVNPTIGAQSLTPGLIIRGRPYVHTVQRNGGNLRWRTNGVEQTGRTIQNNPGVVGRLTLMYTAAEMTGYAAVMRGYVGQFIVFNRILTSTEIDTVESYLANKWGIPLQLWQHSDECFPGLCIENPQFCGWDQFGTYKGVPQNYQNSCCGDGGV